MLLLLSAVGAAQAQQGGDGGWSLRGDTTTRMDYYNTTGDADLGSYAEDGLHAYQDINLGLSRGSTDGVFWDIDLSGVLSRSDYRTAEPGASLEYLRLRHENAAARMPYRLDLGDQHAHFSRLSLDQDLRGVRVELQPGSRRADHSVVWLSGAYRHQYYDTGAGPEGDYHGASWLVADPVFGTWSFNAVHHDAVESSGEEPRHLVASMTGDWEFDVAQQHLDAAAEWAWLNGETRFGDSDAQASSMQGRGWYTEITGVDELTPLPLDYALSYERYGANFEPVGTRVKGDSRALEGTARLRPSEGTHLRSRYHRYLDNAATENPVRIDEYGVDVAVPFWPGPAGATQSLDLSRRERVDRSGNVDQLTRRASWNLNLPLAKGQETRVSLYWLDMDDRAAGLLTRTDQRVSVAHSSTFQVGQLDVTAGPGIAYRTRDGFLEEHSLHPTLSLAASGPSHEFGVDLGYRTLERPGRQAPDLDEYHLGMEWRYTTARHQLGVEYEHLLAEPVVGEGMDQWRVGLFWRYDFSGSRAH